MTTRFITIFIFFFVLFKSVHAWAGTLDSFEDAATKDNSSSYHSDDDSDDDDFSFFQLFLDIIFSSDSEEDHAHSSSDSPQLDHIKQEVGSPRLPFFRYDFNYHHVDSDIHAWDQRLEAGIGQLAGQVRSTRFSETSPNDSMKISYVHAMLRLPMDEFAEFDLGIGSIFLNGNEYHEGTSATAVLALYPVDHVSLRFSPTLGFINENTISDLDVNLAVGHPYGELHVGFRSIESNGETLNGPYVGLSFFF